ncbi:MAG: hypothetical protein AB8G11_04830 [Saprospiraceae bacterium]
MSNLSTFNNKKISTVEQANTKGGIRLITQSYGQAVAKVNHLRNKGTAYMIEYGADAQTGKTIYCIEW